MKIVINAYQYAPTITGTDRMAYNFLRELQKIDTVNQYHVICSQEAYIPSVITAPNFSVKRLTHTLPTSFGHRLSSRLWRTFLPYLIKPLKADVYFSVHNMRLPKQRVARRMIASNLDLIPLVLDEYKHLIPGQAAEIKHTAAVADAFMSISQFSKDELCQQLDVAPDKVTVIHLAADEHFSSKELPTSRLELPEKFIFALGGSEPRKNVRAVVEAFAKLPENLQSAFPLLIAGGSWHGYPLEPLQVNKHIRLLGYVNENDLEVLYKQASAFVFASRYEGFGFTILEAMASGTPVISSSSSSLPEVAGDAALLFAPDDIVALTKHLENLLTSAELQQKLRNAGSQQMQRFSWAHAAQKLHQLLTA